MSSCISTSNASMPAKTALKLGAGLVFSLLALVILFNTVIDPEGVYLRDYLAKRNSESQARQLLSSEFGLPYTGTERPLKYALARVADADCYVIGSSRSFQISLRKDGWLPDDCLSLANLGVSGGSMEDMLILTEALRGKDFSRVYLVVDPWGLNTRLPSRWIGYHANYDRAASRLGVALPPRATNWVDRLKNTVNGEYFKASFRQFRKQGLEALPDFEYEPLPEVPRFDHGVGLNDAVTLPDGSLVYKSSFIESARAPDLTRLDYMSDGVVVDPLGVEVLSKLVDYYRDHGVEVTVVLSPYHPAVFSDDNTAYREKIRAVEVAINEAMSEMEINVRGSYDPRVVGCHDGEFFDAFHPTIQCMSRIALE